MLPKITTRFSSALLNQRNLDLGSQTSEDVITRVWEGLKPVGFYDAPRREELLPLAEEAMKKSVSVLFTSHTSSSSGREHYFLSAARSGLIRDSLDLEALEADYAEWLQEDPEAVEAMRGQIKKLSKKKFQDYLEFRQADADLFSQRGLSKHPAAEYVRSGLLLGYPPKSTACLIGACLGLRGFSNHMMYSRFKSLRE